MRKRRYSDISPDEIFAESTNISHFDTSQFEGRIERPIPRKTFGAVVIIVFLVLATFLGRIWFLQVYKGDVYAHISENNRLDHLPVFAERGVIFDRMGEKLAWNVPNNESDDYSLRQYSDESGLAHVVGYVALPATDSSGVYYQTDFVGKEGVERMYNSLLTGENGTKIIETNALGDILSESTIENPTPGESIYLSIDSRIQHQMYSIMKDLAEEVGFVGGAGVMTDIGTGEIISMVSYPEYSPQILSEGADTEYITNIFADNERTPMLNRVISGLYTPGSIEKPFVSVAALNEDIIDPETEIVSTGSLVIPNAYNPDNPTIFRDWKAHGAVDMRRAIAVSSDVYFYEIGGGYQEQEGLGIDRIKQYMTLFGFAEKTEIGFPSEATGTIPSPEWKQNVFGTDWLLGNTYHTSIGQYGFQVTPIQAVLATSMLANGGWKVEPTIERSDKEARKSSIGISDHYLQIAREGMRDAVQQNGGTATGLNVSYVDIAAKTGTAELGIAKDFVNSWVIGFFPYNDPKYAFAVVMEKGPEDNHLGGVYVMRTLLDWMHKNVPEYFNL